MSSFIQSHTHSDGPNTERDAADAASRSELSTKQKILDQIRQSHMLTPDEFAEMTGGLINTVRRRFTDLWKEGKIKHHPDGWTRPNKNEFECVLWVLGEDQTRKKGRYELLKDEIQRLRGILRRHNIDPDQHELSL